MSGPLSYEDWIAKHGDELCIGAGESGAAYEMGFDWEKYEERAYDNYVAAFHNGIKREVMALYKPPFRYHLGYIWDAEGEMVADRPGENILLRIRGWGRISYLDNPELLQDTLGEIIASTLTDYWMAHNAKP